MRPPATPPPSASADGAAARRAPRRDASRAFVVGATLLLGCIAVVAALAAAGRRLDLVQADHIRRLLDTTTALAAVAAFALCRATWRQSGDTGALWVGTATLLAGVAAATRPELLAPLLAGRGPGAPVLDAVSNAAVLGATALFAAGLLVPATTRRVRPLPLLGAAAVAVALVAVAFRASPGLQSSLSVAQLTGADGLADVAGGLLVTAVWVLIAAGYTVRGVGGWRYTWAGLLLFALTLSGLVAGAARPGDPWSVGAPALEALGMLWAVVACHLQLDRLHDEQRDRLHDSELEAETAEVRERLRAATSRTRRHDLVNAITAIDGAAMILEREFDRLSASDREVLASVLGSGTERLRQLLGQEGLHDSVSLADTAAMVAEEPGWHDRVELDLTPGLLATGSPEETAEALRQLMAYACNRAPTGPVTVRSERDGEWAVLRVEDRGPTMSRDERRTVTAADGRRPPGADGGLGLQVAARLMREQGGDLWVEARPGGGSSFGICLPAAAVPAPPPTPPAAPAEKGTGGGHD